MTRFVGIFLRTDFTGEERHAAGSRMLADYETDRRPAAAARRPPRSRAPMPEGHTLRRLADRPRRGLRRRPVRVSSPQGRFAESTPRCSTAGRSRRRVGGKHLFVEFPGDRFVHVHLGLIGKFDLHPAPAPGPGRPGPAAAARATTTYADLRGATACDLVGREQTRGRCSPRSARTRCAPTPTPTAPGRGCGAAARPIGDLLMDQDVLAGVGNVYRAEVLFRHRMHPLRPGRTLRVGQWRAIWEDLVGADAEGVATGRIDTVRPEHTPEAMGRPAAGGRPRRRGLRLPAHGQPCLVCGAKVRTAELAGRNLFWCPRCQPTFRSRAVRVAIRPHDARDTRRGPADTRRAGDLSRPWAPPARLGLRCAGDVGLGPTGPGLPGAAHPAVHPRLGSSTRTSSRPPCCCCRCSSAASGSGRGRCRGSSCSSAPASACCSSTSRPSACAPSGARCVTFAIALLIMVTSFRRSRLGVSGPHGRVDVRRPARPDLPAGQPADAAAATGWSSRCASRPAAPRSPATSSSPGARADDSSTSSWSTSPARASRPARARCSSPAPSTASSRRCPGDAVPARGQRLPHRAGLGRGLRHRDPPAPRPAHRRLRAAQGRPPAGRVAARRARAAGRCSTPTDPCSA